MNNLHYGIIGNCRSAALVSKKGSIDWCCLPKFDSPSVFAKILDDQKGGSFGFIVDANYTITQNYLPNTAVLVTKFSNGTDAFEVIDFMPRYRKVDGSYHSPPEFIRYLKHLSGTPEIRVEYNPKLEYAKGITTKYIKENFIVSLNDEEAYDTLFLYTDLDKNEVLNGSPLVFTADHYFLVGYNEKLFVPHLNFALLEFERTKAIKEISISKKLSKEDIDGIVSHYKNAKKRLILLDYDGTLVGFKDNPQDAKPDEALLKMLDALQSQDQTTLSLISGRDKETFENWFGQKPYNLITDHGVWMRQKQNWTALEIVKTDWMANIKPILESFVDRTPGTFIETKAYSLAWHYRTADPELAQKRTIELQTVLTSMVSNNNLSVLSGNKVIEIKAAT